MGSENLSSGVIIMDLNVWLPAMFFLGLAGFALMFACIAVCDNV